MYNENNVWCNFFYLAYKWFLVIIWIDPLVDKMAKCKYMDLGIPIDLKKLSRNLGIIPCAPIKRPITEILFIWYFSWKYGIVESYVLFSIFTASGWLESVSLRMVGSNIKALLFLRSIAIMLILLLPPWRAMDGNFRSYSITPGVSEQIPTRTVAENVSKSFGLPAVSAEDSVSATSRKGSDRNNVILQNLNSINLLVSQILILICKFKNAPCALRFWTKAFKIILYKFQVIYDNFKYEFHIK